ncbi:Rv3235 family protein [Streptomyces iranensis]|uniref:Uncharacterized protein n=1 Tax=Streptomyces iranensis TaxID=576784 RepID=A0ABS4N9D4_9ACTN|nr:Rv3235 family protein [Streptomyces iranensis]MBP2068637.1 hypothetical protein [Streptomyces iranensis]
MSEGVRATDRSTNRATRAGEAVRQRGGSGPGRSGPPGRKDPRRPRSTPTTAAPRTTAAPPATAPPQAARTTAAPPTTTAPHSATPPAPPAPPTTGATAATAATAPPPAPGVSTPPTPPTPAAHRTPTASRAAAVSRSAAAAAAWRERDRLPRFWFANRLVLTLSGQRPVHTLLGHALPAAYDQLIELAPRAPLRPAGERATAPVVRRCGEYQPRHGVIEAFARIASGDRLTALAFRLELGADARWRCAAIDLGPLT